MAAFCQSCEYLNSIPNSRQGRLVSILISFAGVNSILVAGVVGGIGGGLLVILTVVVVVMATILCGKRKVLNSSKW